MTWSGPQTDIGGEGLCSLEQVKARIGFQNTQYDVRIEGLIAALTHVLNERYGREFMATGTATRLFKITNNLVSFRGGDLRTATSVVLHPESEALTLTDGTGYSLAPFGGDNLTSTYGSILLSNACELQSSFAGRFGFAQLRIEGTWGIWSSTTEVPGSVNQAAVECVLSLVDRPSANIAGSASGALRETAPAIPATWDVPFGAHQKLLKYNREWGVI